jgi:signal transduction histidine kinase
MHRSKSERAPSFFWQGVLIILPVAILALAGVFSLRQDAILAEAEARRKAGEVADALVPLLLREFDTRTFYAFRGNRQTAVPQSLRRPGQPTNNVHYVAEPELPANRDPVLEYSDAPIGDRYQMFVIGQTNALLYPPPLGSVPAPRILNVSRLTVEQSNNWSAALEAEFTHRDAAVAIAVLDRFLKTSPPPEFAARAVYDSAILLREGGQSEASRSRFQRVVKEYGDLLSEGGIPYRQIALWQCASDPAVSMRTNDQWDLMCREVVVHPTILSEYLLNLALENTDASHRKEIETWIKVWNSHQASREIYEQYFRFLHDQHQFPTLAEPSSTTRYNWIASGNWFACNGPMSMSTNGVVLVMARSHEDIYKKALDIIEGKSGADLAMPVYFNANFVLQDRTIISAGDQRVLLASRDIDGSITSGKIENDDSDPLHLHLDIYLGDAATFYTHQRQRALIFGSLIAVAALAALIGFFAARRAFHRQLHLSEMKSNFVSSVSHELRAPIASVRLMAEGLERGKIQDAQKQNEYFRFIVQECRRLSSLIENVLDFSRIEQGRKQYEFEPTDVVVLAQQTVKLMDTYAAERQIKLALQVTGTPFPFEMDGKAIQQALINLLDNAIKHSPNGSGISVGLDFERSPTTSAFRLSVEDKGEGIPPEEHEKIFERFYRLGSELRRETQGVGIGLSIVKHIVQAHGGKIVVRSAPGQGSRFTIELPTKNGQS